MDAILVTIPPSIVTHIPNSILNTLTGITWFPSTLAIAFLPSLQISFVIGAVISAVAAILSALRGERYIHDDEVVINESKYSPTQELELVKKSS